MIAGFVIGLSVGLGVCVGLGIYLGRKYSDD